MVPARQRIGKETGRARTRKPGRARSSGVMPPVETIVRTNVIRGRGTPATWRPRRSILGEGSSQRDRDQAPAWLAASVGFFSFATSPSMRVKVWITRSSEKTKVPHSFR